MSGVGTLRETKVLFRGRCADIIRHLDLIRSAEIGLLRWEGAGAIVRHLSAQDQHVLKAGVFLHLYNLVEATLTSLLDAVVDAAALDNAPYADLTPEWRGLWRRTAAQIDGESPGLGVVLSSLERLCDSLLSGETVRVDPTFNGGNLDSRSIKENLARFGVRLELSDSLRQRVERRVVDDMGVLHLIKVKRNGLAHGELSFRECGQSVAVADLRSWAATTMLYLRAVISQTDAFVVRRGFRILPA